MRYAAIALLILGLGPWLAGCGSTTGVPGGDAAFSQASETAEGAKRVAADLRGAEALAKAQGDSIAAQCWGYLAERAEKLAAVPELPPEAAGLFTGIQRIRGARRALTARPEEMTIACAPLKEDIRRAYLSLPATLSGLLF